MLCRDATVTIVDTATGQSREAVTSGEGAYSFNDVPEGSYTFTALRQRGFNTSRTNNVPVSINAVTRQDMRLRVEDSAQTVTVRRTRSLCETDSADLHSTLDARERLRNCRCPAIGITRL